MRNFLIVFVGFVGFARCGENFFTINVKSAINTASESFISYEFDFDDVMDLFLQSGSLEKLAVTAPAYVKLRNFSAWLKKENVAHDTANDVALMFQNLKALHVVPVVVVDYNFANFEPVGLLQDMKAIKHLQITECVWQLGNNNINGLNRVSSQKYLDDLKTLKILCDSANKEHSLKWTVATDNTLLSVQTEKLTFDVVGVDSMRLTPADVISKTNSITAKSQVPVWVTIEKSSHESFSGERASQKAANEACDHECLMGGLLHAQVLGDAARRGFDVLFFDQALNATKSLTYAVSLIHKKLVGPKVFNARVTKSTQEGKQAKLYSYCSKKSDGSITLMGINYSNMRTKFNVRLSSPIESNAVVLQYSLSVSDGRVMLNNHKFNFDVTPSYKFKKSQKNSIPLALPPFSMALWTIKNAKVAECFNSDEVDLKDGKAFQLSSSSDQLLKKLVASEFKTKSNAIEKTKRSKRQIGGSGPFLPGFEFELPAFKFPNFMTASSSNLKPIRDVLMNKNTDVYKVSPVEVNPLKSSENPLMPEGDVYLLINDGKNLPNADYVSEDGDKLKRSKANRKKQSGNQISNKETTEAMPEYFIPYDYVDASHKKTPKTTKKSSKKSSQPEQPKEIGELFEAEKSTSPGGRGSDQPRGSSSNMNVELKTVIKELEPTYRQSKTAMLAAKRKWDRHQILELLKDAQLEEVDKSHLKNGEDFEIIDLSQTGEPQNYEEYEEDDDGFFEDGQSRRRLKRSVRNEIPKFGYHEVSDEDEYSIESLIDDTHMFIPARSDKKKEPKLMKITTESPTTTDSPIVIKAIDFFSKSLNDAIEVAHKTMTGWWYVFNPRLETY